MQETFTNLGIAPKLLDILEKNKFITPTPIQAQSIPPAIEGKDLMGIAQTGTGKTLAFGIPMLQRLAQSKGQKNGLVILPTRELALQVDETLKKIGASLGLKTAILIGGEPMQKQIRMLRQNPHIIIATPGRLADHLENRRISLAYVGILVLDEADRMLDMGFEPQIKRILEKVPKDRQTMLFSATMPDEIVKIAKSYLSMPLRVEVAPSGTVVQSVTQELFFVERKDKLSLLKSLLEQYQGSVLIFSRTKHGARKITQSVRDMGHKAVEIHSNRSLGQRIEALEGFKIGRYRIMVATDIAARGIDVSGIQVVMNFDMPATPEDYVHRIGRTGRAGMVGHAITFATPDQRGDVRSIERLIKKNLAVSQHGFQSRPGTTDRPQATPQRYSPNRSRKFSDSRPPRGFSGNRFLRKASGNFSSPRPSFKDDGQKQDGRKRGSSFKKFRNRPKYPSPRRPVSSEGGYFLKRG
jgi:superfamily II DNA/RNA helicase